MNKSGPAQVGAPLKFLKYAKDTVSKRLFLSVPKNTPKDTHKTRKQHFPQLETKNLIFESFGKKRRAKKSFKVLLKY